MQFERTRFGHKNSQRDCVGDTRFPKRSGLANLPRTNRYLDVHAKQRHPSDTWITTRQHQPEHVVLGNIRPRNKEMQPSGGTPF